MVVLKFGGKSLETISKVQKVCEYILMRSKTQKLIVVVSAFGKTTDNLVSQFEQYGGSKEDSRERDVLLATGETQASALVATMLSSMGAKAKSMGAREVAIYAIGSHGSGIITGIDRTNVNSALSNHDILVVAGFQAIDSNGEIITLGRNGSDTTAVAIASAFNTAVEIYSDFDGIYHGDPRRQNYKKIDQINYDDAINLAQSGAPVLSLASTEIAKLSSTPIIAKQSDMPNKSGTYVTNVAKPQTTICTKDNLSKIIINFNGNKTNLQKTTEYILKNVKYISFNAKNNKIELIIEQKYSQTVEFNLAKLNNLLEE